MKVLRISAVAAMLTCCCMIHTSTSAEQFPSRVVKFLVPQAAGGATDVFARKLAQMLSERWGQPIIVENRAGAAGVLGTDAVAKSAADGYTLLVTYAGSQAVNPSLYPNLPFDSVTDFQPIATLARTPFLLVVNPKIPAKDLREFIALARQKPGILTFASSGIGSVNHLLGEMLKVQAGINILHVPYRGVAPAIADVIARHVDSAFSSVPSVLGNIGGGQVRALAVSSAKRVAVAPDVPTIAESGFPGFQATSWWGLMAPAGTAQPILDRIAAEIARADNDPAMLAQFAKFGIDPLRSTPGEFAALVAGDIALWGKAVKIAGLETR
jgi:tripartite-type tricarboxylate transporter receptor subunit TctC